MEFDSPKQSIGGAQMQRAQEIQRAQVGNAGAYPGIPAYPGADQPIGRIAQNAAEAEKLLSVLHDEIAMLEQRIAPMLRPEGPVAGNGACTGPEATPSLIAQAIGQCNTETQRAIYRLRALISRVDI